MKRLFPLLIVLSACAQPTKIKLGDQSWVISNVNIIDVHDGSIIENQFVLIDSGKIKSILLNSENLPDQFRSIDGKDKFLLPGLAEMHAHIPHPNAGKKYLDNTLFLYLSNGVTTIRGMLGHPSHLQLREQAANNELLSPRIFTSSPSLNGNTVTSVEEAKTKVTAYAKDGYDFLKLHPGLKLEVFEEIVKTANAEGIDFSGHVSVDVGIRRALNSKYGSVDHVDGYLEGLVPDSAGVNPDKNGFFGFNFTYLANEESIDELVQLTKENEVWVVPTQALFDRWFSPESAKTLAAQPEMKYIPKNMLQNWIDSKTNLISDSSYSAEKWLRFNTLRRKLIYELNKNGHCLLLGSDAPQVFNVPGFSIHHELKGMRDAGLTPLEAIQIGTLNPAKFFGMEGEFGEVIEGASADLILLNANPLVDLENLKNPAGVMVRGRWLSRENIKQRLKEIAVTP